jgi:hypothetical protein
MSRSRAHFRGFANGLSASCWPIKARNTGSAELPLCAHRRTPDRPFCVRARLGAG